MTRERASTPGLLVSVRSADEAEIALHGGAALIDVKEPMHGPLGQAALTVIAEVARRVAGRRPVSAALGELADFRGPIPDGLNFVKWGLAGCGSSPRPQGEGLGVRDSVANSPRPQGEGLGVRDSVANSPRPQGEGLGVRDSAANSPRPQGEGLGVRDSVANSPRPQGEGLGVRGGWQSFLRDQLRRPQPPQAVVVAYADWECARAPPLDDVVAFAIERPGNVLLVDTHCKEPGSLDRSRRPTLLDWLAPTEIIALCRRCRTSGVRVALAGSLGLAEIALLNSAQPDWFAVRGAVCAAGDRQDNVDGARVRRLVELLAAATT